MYWKTNASEFLGYKPGELVVFDYQGGGGFSGAPQILWFGLASGIAPGQPAPVPAEFPAPNNSYEYRVGGRNFSGYHYHKPKGSS